MPTLQELRRNQEIEASKSNASLNSYFAVAQPQWLGFWVATRLAKTDQGRSPIADPEHTFLFFEHDSEGRFFGVWWIGSKRLQIAGKLNDSKRSVEGATVKDGEKLLTPLSLRAGHQFNSIQAHFEWSIASATPLPDALSLSRLATPRIVAVSSVELNSRCIVKTMTSTLPSLTPAKIVACDQEFGAEAYGFPAERKSSEWCDEAVRSDGFLTWRTSPKNEIAGIVTSDAFEILRTTGDSIVFATDVDDVVRLRAWKAPCLLVYVVIATSADSQPATSRHVDGFMCLDVQASTEERAAAKIVQFLAAH